jgi:hypothetical protein
LQQLSHVFLRIIEPQLGVFVVVSELRQYDAGQQQGGMTAAEQITEGDGNAAWTEDNARFQ